MNAALSGSMASPVARRELIIDFMYLDLETCSRCRGTDANLEAALGKAEGILDAAGVDVAVRKTLVASAEQASALGFVSSPTIRVNGQDIALDLRESACADCSGDVGAIDCRVWLWDDHEHTEAPAAMIVDAVLRAVYADPAWSAAPVPAAAGVPENLARYFAGKPEAGVEPAACCAPAEQAVCCEPSEKASCCGAATGGGCGCR